MRPFYFAGVLLGLAHLSPVLELCAWGGLAVLGGAASLPRRRVDGLKAALCSGLPQYAIALFWLPSAAMWTGSSIPGSLLFASVVWTLCAVLARAPLGLLFLAVRPERRGPLVGAAVVAGELLKTQCTMFPLADVLYSQSSPLLLRLLGVLGWHGTNLVWMTLLCVLGGGLARPGRARAAALMAAMLLLTGRSMCPRREIDPVELHGLAAVQLTADEPWSNSRPALPMPPGTDVAVWPEGVYPDGVVLVEGHQRRKLPHWGAESPRLWHLLGLEGRHRRGAMNMTSLIDPTGTLVWARAKRTLVPLGEAAWKGIPSLGDTFVPGVMSANVRVADHSLAVLLCYELYDRARFAEALVGEATVVALQSSDRPLQASSIAREQVLNTMRLRSAEFGLPIVRASVGGEAAITLPNGVLHRTGRIGTNMTLDGTSTLLAE